MLLCAGLLALMQGCDTDMPTRAAVGVLGRYPMTKQSMQQWKLPGKLREISGLALSANGRVFAVADEKAIVYELDIAEGKIEKAFALGKPTKKGDFEGIAIIGASFFLTTSDGEIYRFSEGEDGERVDYRRFETGIGRHCEIEGLAALRENLLLLCKTLRSKALDRLAIFLWSTVDETLAADLIELPESEILRQLDVKRLNPSGLAVDELTGHLLLVAAQQRALVELAPTGQLIQAITMPLGDRHRQAEGIAITRAGQLMISDEGGRGRARIALYARTRAAAEEQ